MKFYYINHLQERVNFYEDPFYFNKTDILDYQWGYEVENNRIKNIRNNVLTRTFEIYLLPDEENTMRSHLDRLLRIFDVDVINNKSGRLYSESGYFIECMMVANQKIHWNIGKQFLIASYTVLVKSRWTKEEQLSYVIDDSINTHISKRYSYRYPYTYGKTPGSDSVLNTAISPCHFRLIIYKAENPSIRIGNAVYEVQAQIEDGEYLEIDSKKRTITFHDRDGMQHNYFDKRGKEDNIFEKIKPGESTVNWNARFGFDIVLYDERSEPLWT